MHPTRKSVSPMPDSNAITYTSTIGDQLTISGYAMEGIPLITISGMAREGLVDLTPSEARRIAGDLENFARRAERMALLQARELRAIACLTPIADARSGWWSSMKGKIRHARNTGSAARFEP